MSWFLAKIVYRIICGKGEHTPQFDERLRLVEADDAHEAFDKAHAIGLREQESFLNQQQHLVQWQFVNVSELYKISALIDGAELYAKVEEAENADLYMQLVHKKADHIRQNITHQFLQLF
jgi:hypothetical protein